MNTRLPPLRRRDDLGTGTELYIVDETPKHQPVRASPAAPQRRESGTVARGANNTCRSSIVFTLAVAPLKRPSGARRGDHARTGASRKDTKMTWTAVARQRLTTLVAKRDGIFFATVAEPHHPPAGEGQNGKQKHIDSRYFSLVDSLQVQTLHNTYRRRFITGPSSAN